MFQFLCLSFQSGRRFLYCLPGVGTSHLVVLVKNEMGFEKSSAKFLFKMLLALKFLFRVSASMTFRCSIQGRRIPLPPHRCFLNPSAPQTPTPLLLLLLYLSPFIHLKYLLCVDGVNQDPMPVFP